MVGLVCSVGCHGVDGIGAPFPGWVRFCQSAVFRNLAGFRNGRNGNPLYPSCFSCWDGRICSYTCLCFLDVWYGWIYDFRHE